MMRAENAHAFVKKEPQGRKILCGPEVLNPQILLQEDDLRLVEEEDAAAAAADFFWIFTPEKWHVENEASYTTTKS